MTREHIDTTDLDRLSVNLAGARERIVRATPKVLEVGAYKIKQEMQQDFSGHRHLPGLDNKVAYERIDQLGLEWEIGIDPSGQGRLGNVAAYGTSNNAPVADKNRGLRVETPRILEHLGKAAEDSALGPE